jgi:hypothetical protein
MICLFKRKRCEKKLVSSPALLNSQHSKTEDLKVLNQEKRFPVKNQNFVDENGYEEDTQNVTPIENELIVSQSVGKKIKVWFKHHGWNIYKLIVFIVRLFEFHLME